MWGSLDYVLEIDPKAHTPSARRQVGNLDGLNAPAQSHLKLKTVKSLHKAHQHSILGAPTLILSKTFAPHFIVHFLLSLEQLESRVNSTKIYVIDHKNLS